MYYKPAEALKLVKALSLTFLLIIYKAKAVFIIKLLKKKKTNIYGL